MSKVWEGENGQRIQPFLIKLTTASGVVCATTEPDDFVHMSFMLCAFLTVLLY